MRVIGLTQVRTRFSIAVWRTVILVGLNSGSAFSTLGWGVNYSNQMIHFSNGRALNWNGLPVTFVTRITRQFALTATGGYERNSFISIRGSPSAPLWTVGFVWEPTERTNIAVSGGQRFFGNTYSALASHRTRLTAWDFGYTQNITTFNQQAGLGMGLGFGGGLGGSLNSLLAAQNPNLSPDAIQQASSWTSRPWTFRFFFQSYQFFDQPAVSSEIAAGFCCNEWHKKHCRAPGIQHDAPSLVSRLCRCRLGRRRKTWGYSTTPGKAEQMRCGATVFPK